VAYDYIVVGAGSAGCVLANRLSANPANRVLLLEAGPEDRNKWIHIPLGYGKNIDNPEVNWCFESQPEDYCYGQRYFLPRGKVLGGTSSINGMVFVRGQVEDFDGWAQLGCRGWSYSDVLPYFIKCETNSRGASDLHGGDGPLSVSDVSEQTVISRAMLAAGQEIGIPYNEDLNARVQEGIGWHQATIGKGRRSSTAVAYLKPARTRPNLDVQTGALVRRVLFDGKRAVGVEYDRDGARWQEQAGGAVILSGGAFASPQILELSGIGNPERLRALGVPVVHALPGVGENLQDHFVAHLRWRMKNVRTYNDRTHGLSALLEGLNYVLRRKGVLTQPTLPISAFIRSRPELASPDLQLQIFTATYRALRDKSLDRLPGVTIGPTVLRLEGRGHVHAQSPDPAAPPAIWHNLLATETDRRALVTGMRVARKLMAADAMKPYLDHEMTPGETAQTDEELIDYARREGRSSLHPAGTCKMGVDDRAVVDPALKVHGVDGLRVADASIMPNVVCGNTNAATIMIGEKAADMILAEQKHQ
jgi:choline dehydrogenase